MYIFNLKYDWLKALKLDGRQAEIKRCFMLLINRSRLINDLNVLNIFYIFILIGL